MIIATNGFFNVVTGFWMVDPSDSYSEESSEEEPRSEEESDEEEDAESSTSN